MKTVLHGNVDGYEIVLGYSEATVDPVSTQIKVDALAQGIPESTPLDALKQKIADRWAKLDQDFTALFNHSSQNLLSTGEMQWYGPAKSAAQLDVDALASQIAPLQAAVDAARAKIRAANTVYFPCGANEDAITDEQYASLKAAGDVLAAERDGLGADAQLLLNGGRVADYRKQTFWTLTGSTWTSRTISKLGDSPAAGEIADEDLTSDQRSQIQAQLEAARIAALTPDQKAAELAAVLSSLADQAVAMDAKASIQGTAATGKAWYASQAAIANGKYGVSTGS
jgi:hypothetical protein